MIDLINISYTNEEIENISKDTSHILYNAANYCKNYIYENKYNKEIINELIKYNQENKNDNLTPLSLSYLILNNYKIYIDFDDVIVNLLECWIEWCNKTYKGFKSYKEIKYQNVDNFNYFKELQEFYNKKNPHIDIFKFLNSQNCYDFVSINKNAQLFLNNLNQLGFQKYYILSATYIYNIISKYTHIIEKLKLTKNHIIFAYDKAHASNTTFGTLIDDGYHNLINLTSHNHFCYTYLIEAPHNINYNNENDRIIKIKKENAFENILDLLPLNAIKNIIHLNNKDNIKKLYI